MPEHAAVGDHVGKAFADARQSGEKGLWEHAALGAELIDGGGNEQRCGGADHRAGAGGGHDTIIAQRTTVKFSSGWNTSFSSSRPITPITAMPASITSVLR